MSPGGAPLVVVTARCPVCYGLGHVHDRHRAPAISAATQQQQSPQCLAEAAARGVNPPQELLRSFRPCTACLRCENCVEGRVLADGPASPTSATTAAATATASSTQPAGLAPPQAGSALPTPRPSVAPSFSRTVNTTLQTLTEDAASTRGLALGLASSMSLSSLVSETESMVARRAGKAGRKRRSEAPHLAGDPDAPLSATSPGAESLGSAAYSSPAAVAALSMSRVRQSYALSDTSSINSGAGRLGRTRMISASSSSLAEESITGDSAS
ncbi:hypothetical protein HK405_001489, partial [Cladochytrium tenue]